MFPKSRSPRYFFLLLLVGVPLVFSSAVDAGTLQGQVFGKNKAPKPFLRMEFAGATRLTAVTDANGRYRISGPGGTYRLRISDGGRRMEEYVTVPDGNKVSGKNFKLGW